MIIINNDHHFLHAMAIFLIAVHCLLYCDIFSHVDQFHDIPYLDDANVILRSELLHIKEYPDAFNASFIEHIDGYLTVFRQDSKKSPDMMPLTISMGLVNLNRNFIQSNKAIESQLEHIGAHDGRLFYYDHTLYILYTHLLYQESSKPGKKDLLRFTNRMHQAIANLDENWNIVNVRELNYGTQKKEKNWTPFEYQDAAGMPHLYFVYRFNPKEIICLKESGAIEQIIKDANKSQALINMWENRWGEIRGGTPAINIGDEYLTFFHSSFKNKNQIWYVFGALTFQKDPPFTITKISKYPILAHNFYKAESNDQRLFSHDRLVMFPCGLICENNLIHVLCGENDIGIRLVTFDKKRLLECLKSVWTERRPILVV